MWNRSWQWLNCNQWFLGLGTHPVRLQLSPVELNPFFDKAEGPPGHVSMKDLPGRDEYLRLELPVASMEMRRRVISVVHGDHDSVEERKARHGAEGTGDLYRLKRSRPVVD